MIERYAVLELIERTKRTLDSIKNLTHASRGKFGDRIFGEFFYRTVTKDIEQNDLLLNGFLNYLEVTTPLRRKDTVNTLIEGALKKQRVRLEEKKIQVLKKLEPDLPETIVPDEQLRFILDSAIQNAITLIPPGGSIEFITKPTMFHGESVEDGISQEKNKKQVEILMGYTSPGKPREQPGKEQEIPTYGSGYGLNLIWRLVEDIVRRNQGMMKRQVDEVRMKSHISLRFPVERRKKVFYQMRTT